MLANILNDIVGIGIFPTIAFVIFFSAFVGVIVYVIKADKNHMKKMSEMPLDADDE